MAVQYSFRSPGAFSRNNELGYGFWAIQECSASKSQSEHPDKGSPSKPSFADLIAHLTAHLNTLWNERQFSLWILPKARPRLLSGSELLSSSLRRWTGATCLSQEGLLNVAQNQIIYHRTLLTTELEIRPRTIPGGDINLPR